MCLFTNEGYVSCVVVVLRVVFFFNIGVLGRWLVFWKGGRDRIVPVDYEGVLYNRVTFLVACAIGVKCTACGVSVFYLVNDSRWMTMWEFLIAYAGYFIRTCAYFEPRVPNVHLDMVTLGKVINCSVRLLLGQYYCSRSIKRHIDVQWWWLCWKKER